MFEWRLAKVTAFIKLFFVIGGSDGLRDQQTEKWDL